MDKEQLFEGFYRPLTLAVQESAVLGEGLQWHAPTGRWWWTDIQSSKLHAWSPADGLSVSFQLPDRLGCFAHTRSGRLLLGLAKRLSLTECPSFGKVSSTGLQLRSLAPVDAAERRTRINDGRCDRSGRFVFGTMNEAPDRRAIGSFYQYSMRHGLRRLALPTVVIPNSICFSPDGKRMYFCDTTTRTIMQCDYDSNGATVSNLAVFTQMQDESAWPDGSVVDAEGCLWNAQWGAAQVSRYSLSGELLGTLPLPAKNPTCPALGGPRDGFLMVTTARQELTTVELERMPLSGSLFSSAIPVGLAIAEPLFDDTEAALQGD